MKKLIILAVVLALMVMTSAVLATPGANSPWTGGILLCPHPSDPDNPDSGLQYYNPNSGKTHCFKA